MRWFRRLSEADETKIVVLSELCARLEAACSQVSARQSGLELALKQAHDDIGREIRGIIKEHQEDYGRLHAAIESARNSIAGSRGGRPSKADAELERQALALGRQVLEQCATPEGALAFAADIEAKARAAAASPAAAPNGKPSPI